MTFPITWTLRVHCKEIYKEKKKKEDIDCPNFNFIFLVNKNT